MRWKFHTDPFYRWVLQEAAHPQWRTHEDCSTYALTEPHGVAEQA